MSDDAHAGPSDDGPTVVVPSTTVSVAFPFSRVTVDEPGELVIELARLVERPAVLASQSDRTGQSTLVGGDVCSLVSRLERETRS